MCSSLYHIDECWGDMNGAKTRIKLFTFAKYPNHPKMQFSRDVIKFGLSAINESKNR